MSSGLHLKELDALGKNDLAVNTLGRDIADLSVGGIQFVQTLDGSARTVANPVVLEVTKGNSKSTALRDRSVGTRIQGIVAPLEWEFKTWITMAVDKKESEHTNCAVREMTK